MTTLPTQITAMFQDQTINHYNITGVIGEGGQGLVLQLENGDGKTYTGKVIQRRLSLTPYIEELKDLKRGIDISQHLDHPSIQTVKEIIDIPDQSMFVVVKEYAKGRSLKEIIEEDGTISPEELAPIIGKTVEALEYLHDESQHPKGKTGCHRDIKPEHIIVDDEGNVTLIDLDTSKSTSNQTTRYTAAGTKSYQSPEALLGSTSPDGDYYALGFTATEALLGEIPNELSDSRFRGSNPYKMPEWIPEEFRNVIEKMVHPEQKQRYHTAIDIRNDFDFNLEEIVDEEIKEIAVVEGKDYASLRNDLKKKESKLKALNFPISMLNLLQIFSLVSFPIVYSVEHSLLKASLVTGGIVGGLSIIDKAIFGEFKIQYKQVKRDLHLLDTEEQYGTEVRKLEEQRLDLIKERSRDRKKLPIQLGLTGAISTAGYYLYNSVDDVIIPFAALLTLTAIHTKFTISNYLKRRKKIKSLEDRIETAKLPEGVRLGENFDSQAYHDFILESYNKNYKKFKIDFEIKSNDLFRIKIERYNNLGRYLNISTNGQQFIFSYSKQVNHQDNYVLSTGVSTKEELDNFNFEGFPKEVKRTFKKFKRDPSKLYNSLRAMLPDSKTELEDTSEFFEDQTKVSTQEPIVVSDPTPKLTFSDSTPEITFDPVEVTGPVRTTTNNFEQEKKRLRKATEQDTERLRKARMAQKVRQ